jgi:hypothetical protein
MTTQRTPFPFVDGALVTALGDHFRSRPYNPEDSPAVTAYYQGIEAVLNYLYQRVIAQEAESLESNKPVLAESVRERYRRQPRLRFDS